MDDSSLQNAIYINYATIFVCCTYGFISMAYLMKLKIDGVKIFLFPSIIIPSIILLGYCNSLVWKSFDETFRIPFLRKEYIDESALIILIFSILLVTGITYGRNKVLKNILNSQNKRILDLLFYGDFGNKILILIVFLSIFIFPFTFALKVDLIFNQGIRNLQVNNGFLIALIPLARISMLILSIFSGIHYAYKRENLVLIVPLLDTLHNLMKLSRGFFLPFFLFFFASSLAGKKYPKWMYYLAPVMGIISGATAINARRLSTSGVSGYFTELAQTDTSLIESVRHFFEVNSTIGIVSTIVSIRNINIPLVDGFIYWVKTIVPIPTFLGFNPNHLSFARLMGISHAGIPMPALCEIFFIMGWIGLLIFFFLGYLLGKLEGELIKHILLHGRPYWPDIVMWLSLLFGFILSFHSPSRSATRYFLYSTMMLWTMKSLVTAGMAQKINK